MRKCVMVVMALPLLCTCYFAKYWGFAHSTPRIQAPFKHRWGDQIQVGSVLTSKHTSKSYFL